MLGELIRRMTMTVSELNDYANRLLMNDEVLQGMLVTGEVSNFRAYPSGHWYFSLKDEQSSVRCVMFKQYNRSVGFDVTDGMHLTIGGYASIYPRDGSFQVYVQTMQSEGVGSLFEQLERLKKQLSEKGLFDGAHKKALPRYPGRIGVVTSPAGAVIRDIIEVGSRRNPNIDILLVPVSVQGKTAATEIARAITLMNQRDDIDVIIIGRGGGSIEDLWAFNEEVVAYAIFESRIPIISAVGHETDTSISDLVADRRAPTPSAAAELAVPLFDAWLQLLDVASMRLRSVAKAKAQEKARLCRSMTAALSLVRIGQRLTIDRQRIDKFGTVFFARALFFHNACEQRAAMAAAKLEAYSVQSVLNRGYAAISDAGSGKAISGVGQLCIGQGIRLLLRDGSALACVSDKKNKEGEGHD
jgi:exodeoxyribonuclease VII large subunit